ncbi:LemA family protein [Candidatus Gracilibacteria bacterium]|nr:LemA family protein [Candidatus Gracilibacteria bacterium]NUJ99237.1 LemA family protein [Candidatus Gracilibacteria bacterium]
MDAFIFIIVVIVIIGVVFVSKYNGMIKMRNVREQSFADIDVQLKQRFDLIPNLVNTVKGYAEHESGTLEKITEARTSFMNAGDNVDKKIEADNMLAGALKSLFAVSENYPDLKANTNFLELQRELSDIENKIAATRRFFNNATQEYNSYIEVFPNNIVANMFAFKKEMMYEITNEEEKQNIKVEF